MFPGELGFALFVSWAGDNSESRCIFTDAACLKKFSKLKIPKINVCFLPITSIELQNPYNTTNTGQLTASGYIFLGFFMSKCVAFRTAREEPFGRPAVTARVSTNLFTAGTLGQLEIETAK